ncbi:hypothetical protein [Nocardioides massiliensis]|uniref:Uncharacterized protein n=1 Tax=Nocardioides massiliensis TaxID=1325935 RepID=A0ABT9NQT5_9ACTN|nr:hypothetical protein [Nocardioides massiliensis]MDP9822789.1 hypothetical protein [Nocardioides massiliensis]
MSTPIATLEERHARILDALTGVDLTEDEERFVAWMAGWDDSTVDRLINVLRKVRAGGAADCASQPT